MPKKEFYEGEMRKEVSRMKRLPDSELELMQIIWDAGHPVTRLEIEYQLPVDRKLSATTILSFLSRLQDKGFVDVYREGKSNVYEAAVPKKAYLQEESRSIWKRLYQNSVGNFMTALGSGDELSDEDLDELQDFLDRERRERGK